MSDTGASFAGFRPTAMLSQAASQAGMSKSWPQKSMPSLGTNAPAPVICFGAHRQSWPCRAIP